MKKRRINVKKLVEEVFYLALAIVGIIIFICNLTKTCPTDNIFLSYIIGYGFVIGPVITILSIGTFFEVRG